MCGLFEIKALLKQIIVKRVSISLADMIYPVEGAELDSIRQNLKKICVGKHCWERAPPPCPPPLKNRYWVHKEKPILCLFFS